MLKSGLLIAFLLVSFKVASQTDTGNKVVLSERVAREVLKDLARYDALIETDSLKDEKIDNLNQIIKLKDDSISEQKKLIDKYFKPKFSGFIGGENMELNPQILIYGTIKFDYDKFNVSGRYYFNTDSKYTINVEYKLF